MPKRRILIVDNSDELRVSIADVLGKLGHDVVAIGDREAALARADLEEFDLIISDLTEDASTLSVNCNANIYSCRCLPAPFSRM